MFELRSLTSRQRCALEHARRCKALRLLSNRADIEFADVTGGDRSFALHCALLVFPDSPQRHRAAISSAEALTPRPHKIVYQTYLHQTSQAERSTTDRATYRTCALETLCRYLRGLVQRSKDANNVMCVDDCHRHRRVILRTVSRLHRRAPQRRRYACHAHGMSVSTLLSLRSIGDMLTVRQFPARYRSGC